MDSQEARRGRVLGLDLGPTSIGWFLWGPEADDGSREPVAAGVRIFPEGLDRRKGEASLNLQRRTARSARKRTRRNRERIAEVTAALVSAGFWPTDPAELRVVRSLDPYEVRSRALREQVTPFEVGLSLLHLVQRRGFLSTRKAGESSDDGKVKVAIAELHARMKEAGSKFYGDYFHSHAEEIGRIRGRWMQRQLVQAEFDEIWDTQAQFHPGLTEEFRWGSQGPQLFPAKPIPGEGNLTAWEQFGVEGVAFFQRTTYWHKESIGQCPLESARGNPAPRLARAHREFEYFRLLDTLNNLRFVNPVVDTETGEITCKLTNSMRTTLVEQLRSQKSMTMKAARKRLGLVEAEFTRERSAKSESQKVLVGLTTDQTLNDASDGAYGKLGEREKSAVNAIVIDDQLPQADALTQLAQFGLRDDAATALLEAAPRLGSGRASYSLAAIRKLVPHLEQGHPLQSNDDGPNAVEQAGYNLSWVPNENVVPKLKEPEHLPNPIALAALYQVRKVVNAIIEVYGLPDHMRVELARDLKMSARQREEYQKETAKREKARDTIRGELREQGVDPKPQAILRWELWQQQLHTCIGCGTPLTAQAVIHGDAQVDHILPRWRSLDDSQMNKVLLCSVCNSAKKDRTFAEWLGADSHEFKAVVERSKGLAWGKRRRIERTTPVDLDDFTQRQLQDTRYISRETRSYLATLYRTPGSVEVVSGGTTAMLRREWGLNSILNSTDDSKTRDDHRHHAVDAAVVALATASLVKKVALFHQSEGRRGIDAPLPWPSLRADIGAEIEKIVPSHKRITRPKGALHEETIYGRTQQSAEPVPIEERPWARDWIESDQKLVVRKPVENLKVSDFDHVRDRALRDELISYAAANGWTPEARRAFTRPSGRAVKRVRMIVGSGAARERSASTPGAVLPGNNHRANVWKTAKGTWEITIDTTWDVIQGKPMGQPKRHEGAEYLFSVKQGDAVVLGDDLFVVTGLDGEGRRILMRRSTDAGKDPQRRLKITGTAAQRGPLRKVTVDAIGRVSEPSDDSHAVP